MEEIADALVDSAKGEGSAAVRDLSAGEDKEAEAGTVHVGEGFHIEDDVACAVRERGAQLRLEEFEGSPESHGSVEFDFDGLVWELGKRGVERHGQHFSPICAVRQQKSGRVDLRRVDVGRRRAGKEAEGSEDNTLDRGWGWAYERACSRMRQVATTGAQQNKSAG